MSNYKYNGVPFTDIVASGTTNYPGYTPLTYFPTTDGCERIVPSANDITSVFRVPTIPTNMKTGSSVKFSTDGTFTATAPTWANSFKCRVLTRRGQHGGRVESNQEGISESGNGNAGHVGVNFRSEVYTPLGTTDRTFTIKVNSGDNAENSAQSPNYQIKANNGGHGERFNEGHSAQDPYMEASGPHATWSDININTVYPPHPGPGITYNDLRTDYDQSVELFWFS